MSPRRLHSANVFLIKLTTFPILIIIGVYERFLAAGREWRETGRDSPSLFTSLPRQLKNMPILEGLVGTRAEDLVEGTRILILTHFLARSPSRQPSSMSTRNTTMTYSSQATKRTKSARDAAIMVLGNTQGHRPGV